MPLKIEKGVWFAIAIILLWIIVMAISWTATLVVSLLLIPVTTHLYTGLFITAHDAMHGTVSRIKSLNDVIGKLCLMLFSFNSWKTLYPQHHKHHAHPASDEDPDYGPPNFWSWYFTFIKTYVSIRQIVFCAIFFNILKLYINEFNLLITIVLCPFLSTLQLFYFGTFLPHRGEHNPNDPHKARSTQLSPVWAFLSCYFFGYHHEHHTWPSTPWWQLYQRKA